MLAADAGHVDVLQALLELGADCNAQVSVGPAICNVLDCGNLPFFYRPTSMNFWAMCLPFITGCLQSNCSVLRSW